MRKRWILCAAVCLVALPVWSGGPDTAEGTDDPKDAHRALREAVEDIRIHYAPDAEAYKHFEFQYVVNRPGLGLIIRSEPFLPNGAVAAGAEIMAVTPGSPADEAGLQAGDVVVAWNGEPLAKAAEDTRRTAIEASRELIARSRKLEEGDTVTLRYLRDGTEAEVTLVARKIEYLPRMAAAIAGRADRSWVVAPGSAWRPAKPWFLPRGWLDMEMVEINPELGRYFGSDTGVLVVRGPAEDEVLGLESGDVILRIGDREVKNPEHVMRILHSYEPDEQISVDIIRHGRSETLTGTVPGSSFRFDYQFRSSGGQN